MLYINFYRISKIPCADGKAFNLSQKSFQPLALADNLVSMSLPDSKFG